MNIYPKNKRRFLFEKFSVERSLEELFLFLIESSKNASMPSTMAPEPSLNGALTYLGLRAKGVEKETRDWFLNRIIKFGQLVYIKKVKQWLSIENEEEIDI